MKRIVSNAFTRAAVGPRNPQRTLASSLAPMQASFESSRGEHLLQLSPMTAADAAAIWCTSGENCSNLVYDVCLETAGRADDEGDLARLCRDLGIDLLDAFDASRIVLSDLGLREFLSVVPTRRLRMVRIDGPIEQSDADAITTTDPEAASPLASELRSIVAAEVRFDRTILMQSRRAEPALSLVAENFRHYLAAVCNEPAARFGAPQPSQVQRLLEVSGLIAVRPIETEVYSSFVDVGVCASATSGPATGSLIYDLPSGTWHDED